MDQSQGVIFVGGGLANGLAALRLHGQRPESRWLMLERGPLLGGDHTWSCHGHDLTPAARQWLSPLVTREWPRHEVRFPGMRRVFDTPYLSIRSGLFHRHLKEVFGDRIRLNTEVAQVEGQRVVLANGEELRAALVIDGRGLNRQHPLRGVGYQKFRGLFVTTHSPHGLEHPIVMDATISQVGGYRFFYVLPWSPTELLVEDTYYDESDALPGPEKDPEITSYLSSLDIKQFSVTGIEQGILPIPLHGAEAPRPAAQLVTSGLAAGLFHPTTGYSLPDAVRFADWLAAQPNLSSEALANVAAERAAAHWRRGSFYRRLNNMLFRATAPDKRYQILSKFHEHDPMLISRFYAGTLRRLDTLRILSRKPPIPLAAAARAFFTRVVYDV